MKETSSREPLEAPPGEGVATPVPAPQAGEPVRASEEELEGLNELSVSEPVEIPKEPGRDEDQIAKLDYPKERFSWAWVALSELDERTKRRILGKAEKAGGRKVKDHLGRSTHWKAKKKRRRETYQRSERRSKLARDRWLVTEPEGLWFHYKRLASRKKRLWLIERDVFVKLLRETVIDNQELYKYIFYIYRIDKNKDYTIDNIYIVDRYTNKELYRYSSKELLM